MRILVLGAGAWGTALAINASERHEVSLWLRDAHQADALRAMRENQRYLPGHALPASVEVLGGATLSLGPLASQHELVIVATPMAGLRGMLTQLRDVTVPVAWLCKGFEAGDGASDGLLGHEILAAEAPDIAGGVLSGPSFAQEVARGLPAALVAASPAARVRDTLVEAFHGRALRVYANDDIVGVETGGAVKNVLAIATGLCDGLGLGLNARAALITRGMAEMTRLGVALGGRVETFLGLSGLGDLVLTATGDLSRNRRVGLLLAQGQRLDEVLVSLGHVAEGVYCARAVLRRADQLGVEMPITAGVVRLLDGKCTAGQAVAELMGRAPRSES